jgi:hypothetical protein
VLDANVFVEAKNRYYGFDLVPAFWTWLERQADAGEIASTDMIYDELKEGGDDLADWVKDRRDLIFHIPSSSQPVANAVGQLGPRRVPPPRRRVREHVRDDASAGRTIQLSAFLEFSGSHALCDDASEQSPARRANRRQVPLHHLIGLGPGTVGRGRRGRPPSRWPGGSAAARGSSSGSRSSSRRTSPASASSEHLRGRSRRCRLIYTPATTIDYDVVHD